MKKKNSGCLLLVRIIGFSIVASALASVFGWATLSAIALILGVGAGSLLVPVFLVELWRGSSSAQPPDQQESSHPVSQDAEPVNDSWCHTPAPAADDSKDGFPPGYEWMRDTGYSSEEAWALFADDSEEEERVQNEWW